MKLSCMMLVGLGMLVGQLEATPKEPDFFPCCREEMVGGVPRACYVDETCLNTPPGKFGGLGCNADGTANCRFCGWGPYAQDIKCPQDQGTPPPTPSPAPTPAPVYYHYPHPTMEPTPTPMKYTPPPAPEADFFPCCREEMVGGVPRACYVDETCLNTPPGKFGGLGCNADGTANCRFCGWGPYAKDIKCPQDQGTPPPAPSPAPTPFPSYYHYPHPTMEPTPPPVAGVDCAKLGWPGSCGAFTDEASCNCWVKSVFGCSWSHGKCKH